MKIKDINNLIDEFQKVGVIEFDGQSDYKFLFKGYFKDIPQDLLDKKLDNISTLTTNNYLGLFVELED